MRAQATHDKLAAAVWTFVVLQEQSVIPSLAAQRETGMYPAVRAFTTAIRAASAEPVLLLTWAHRDGFRDVGFMDYASMQAQITAGYLEIADELGVRVAPAGVAWQTALARDSTLDLWKPDGSHPTLAGTYLAACVLYATLYFESPVGLSGAGGHPAERRAPVAGGRGRNRDGRAGSLAYPVAARPRIERAGFRADAVRQRPCTTSTGIRLSFT